MQKKTHEPKEKLLEELVIDVKSVVKVNKGGRRLRFAATVAVGDGKGKVGLGTGKANEVQDAIKKASQDATNNVIKIDLVENRTISHDIIGKSGSAIVVVGDRKGKVGLGIGKANEVPDAIKKAIQDANKNLITIPLIDGRTVAHEAIGTAGAARVIIKPASAGTGIIAGGSVRAILELAGIRDVVSKSLGARTKLNMATAALNALKSIKTPEEVAALRGKTVEEILG